MKISHFLYNAFLIEHEGTKIAIDPGQKLWVFDLRSLIPKAQRKEISLFLITHGDPDHYWHADRVAKAAGAPVVLNKTMVKQEGSNSRILAPRRRGLQFVPFTGRVCPLDVGEAVNCNGVHIEGIRSVHGPNEFRIFGLRKRVRPDQRNGSGSAPWVLEFRSRTKLLSIWGTVYCRKNGWE
jgi:L-ascorbate metabolism protein UlaG (beta-lactamase superfamily)